MCIPFLEIGATFLKQRSAQKKTVEPSVGTTKRPRVESIAEDVPVDPTAAISDDDEDDADVDAAAIGPSTASLSLRSMLKRVLETQSSHHIMMETFMTTQAAHGQLLDDLITYIVALRADFAEYRTSFPPPPPSDS